jgi:hypothetical protein
MIQHHEQIRAWAWEAVRDQPDSRVALPLGRPWEATGKRLAGPGEKQGLHALFRGGR